MVKKRTLLGDEKYLIINDNGTLLLLDEDDINFIASNNANIIIHKYRNNLLEAEVLVDSEERAEKLFMEYFGPKQLLTKMVNLQNGKY